MKNDYIKREDAHDMVRSLTRYVNKEIRDMHGVNEMVDYDDVQSGLDKIPAASAWISVKDRLPEQSGLKVLVSAQTKNGKCNVFTAFLGYGAGKWYTPDHTMMECPYKGQNEVSNRWTISHWMPLPESPREAKEMILTRHCNGCVCFLCRWQGTDNCLYANNSFCDACRGKNDRGDCYYVKAWDCDGFCKKKEGG